MEGGGGVDVSARGGIIVEQEEEEGLSKDLTTNGSSLEVSE